MTTVQRLAREIFAAVLLGSALAAVSSCAGPEGVGPTKTASVEAAVWYCPMHPTYTSDRPGDCPICHMRLVELVRHPARPDREQGAASPATGAAAGSDVPGEEAGAPGAGVPAGWSEVHIPLERLQQSGVTFGTVATKRMARTLRTVGRVAIDEKRLHHVHTRLPGWIEHLDVDTTGRPVRRGDPLFALYAPDLLAAQEEYLQAVAAARTLAPSPDPDVARGAKDLLEAARRRLELWDVGPDQIARLERTRVAERTVSVRSPITGIVVEKSALHGMYVDPATVLFTIADLSRVWVLADVYENELSLVHEGARAEVSLPYLPGPSREGRIAFVAPVLDPATRTVKVRIELDNPSGVLRPDMLADVAIAFDAGPRTVIPKSAVVQTGDRSVVFVDLGGGRLAPREIEVGLRFDDDLEVRSGLSPGERVVTSAAFVVDSDSRLHAAVSSAAQGAHPDDGGARPPSPPPSGPGAPSPGPRERPPSASGPEGRP